LGAEVSSDLDLDFALAAGFKPRELIVDGLVKSDSFLKRVIELGVDTVNAESVKELISINDIAAVKGEKIDVGIRCRFPDKSFDLRNLLVKLGTRAFDKFGISHQKLMHQLKDIKKLNYINIKALMIHNTNTFVHKKYYATMLRYLFRLSQQLSQEGINIEQINLGGGNFSFKDDGKFRKLVEIIEDSYRRNQARFQRTPTLVFEPGKALVENAGFLVGKVIRRCRRWLIVDFSKSDYGFLFPFRNYNVCLISNKMPVKFSAKKKYYLKASNLSQYDVFARAVKLSQLPAKGDWLAVNNMGAYSLAFSYQFIKLRPAVYLLERNHQIKLMRSRETLDNVMANQCCQ
jgi:diaminopimelate decarboxylase